MNYTKEFNLLTFEAWSGATKTKQTIIDNDKVDEFNDLLEDFYADSTIFDSVPTERNINDLLWFEDDYIFEQLGIVIDQ